MLSFLLWLVLGLTSAHAQNTMCATRSAGDSTNACASTAFVNGASAPTIGNFTPNLPLIGGPTGYFAQGTRSGNSTLYPTVDATPISGNCAVFDSFGGLNNVACSPSGSGTVGAGLAGQLASYPSNGTSVVGSTTGAGVLSAIGNAIGAASGLPALDSVDRLTNFMGGSDWLATYSYGQTAAILGLGGTDYGGVTGAARTSTNASAGDAMLGGAFWGFGDGGTNATNPVWGLYSECRAFSNSSTGFCAGSEIEVTNFKSGTQPVITDPYNSEATGATYGLHLGSGGGCQNTVSPNTPCYNPVTGLTNLVAPNAASAALTISSNSGTRYGLFNNGIVFSCGSIGTTDCSGTGAGNAILLYSGLYLQWFAPSNLQTFQLGSDPGTTVTGGKFIWTNNGFFMSGERTSPTSSIHAFLCIDGNGVIYNSPNVCN